MVKVKKRSGKLEEFMESKIVAGCKRAGATAQEAVQVARDVSLDIVKMAVVPAEKLSNVVVASLRKVNKAATDTFVKFREQKLKKKKSK